jgi:hypothetical protein
MEVLARIYFSITGLSINRVGVEKKTENYFLFPTREMETKIPHFMLYIDFLAIIFPDLYQTVNIEIISKCSM